MSKVYLKSYDQLYKREIVDVANPSNPQRYIPIIKYAIERYMMGDVNFIDAVYIDVVYTPPLSYCGSEYMLRDILHPTERAPYFRVQYPDANVYFREYWDYGVDDFFTLLVVDAICLEYNLVCRISVEIIKNLDSDANFYARGYSYLCEL